MAKRGKPFRTIRTPGEVDAIKSPVRERIIAIMGELGPCTIKDVATRMNWRPESLYYHFRKLIDVGFVVEKGKRAAVRRPETIYHLAWTRFHLARRGGSRPFLRAVFSLYDSQLRGMARRIRRALFDKRTVHEGARRNLHQARYFIRLNGKSLAGLNQKLAQVSAYILEHDRPTKDDQSLEVIIAVAPAYLEEGDRT